MKATDNTIAMPFGKANGAQANGRAAAAASGNATAVHGLRITRDLVVREQSEVRFGAG